MPACMTYGRRCDLEHRHGLTPKPPTRFLGRLRQLDPSLTLIWHPKRKHWVVYRVMERGQSPREDLLMKEFRVCGPKAEFRPLGDWVIREMRRVDITYNGSVCWHHARALVRKEVEREAKLEVQMEDERHQVMAEEVVKELYDYSYKNRRTSNPGIPLTTYRGRKNRSLRN